MGYVTYVLCSEFHKYSGMICLPSVYHVSSEGDQRSNSGCWPGVKKLPLPPKSQDLIKVWAHMEHVVQGPSGDLLDWLPPGDVPLSVPECVGPGCAPQYGPLPGPGVSPGVNVAVKCALS